MNKDHRPTLQKLIRAHGLTQARVAELLSEASGDQVALRTVENWLAEGANHRRCPGWAIVLLKEKLR